MTKSKIAAFLLLCSFSPSAWSQETDAGQAPCDLQISVRKDVFWRGLYGRGYEAAAPVVFEPAEISIRHQGAACSYFVSFSGATTGLQGQNGTLVYDILDSPNGRSLNSVNLQGNALTRIEGTFEAEEAERTIEVFLSVPSRQLVRAGTYQGGPVVHLYRNAALPELVEQVQIPVTVPVAANLSVTSSDFQANRTDVSLGSLEQGGQANLSFHVDANIPVRVRVESLNAGKLRHELGVASIPYNLTLESTKINLSSGGYDKTFDIPVDSGRDIGVDITTDPVKSAPAGNYIDTVTFVFSSDG
jgi:hypothetical protein